ncbi:hypothetical protein [Novosphingobium sp. KN65.2]|uniref:hypothetical protein n=1 Tax=Novosphingobium sp. KN65.2 TaxID=1478134 RepID=UPI0005E0BFB5|nr:hypothetical protein [Novosphingobium sp. KN65.2]CDO37626.1 hypothetical protein SPHV1_370013 [Novosphingobium sp. KN65.2]
MSTLPPEWRAQIKEQYLGIGASAVEADQIIDLASHAVDQAIDAISRVADSAGDDIGLNVLPLACQLMAMRCEGAYQVMESTMLNKGDASMTTFTLNPLPMGEC